MDGSLGTQGMNGAGADASAPRFKGKPIELGGVTYTVPPLALGQVRELLPRITKLNEGPASSFVITPDQIETMLDVVLAAVKRNYPAMTREDLETTLDLGNIRSVFATVLGSSGFDKASGDGLGNASAGTASP